MRYVIFILLLSPGVIFSQPQRFESGLSMTGLINSLSGPHAEAIWTKVTAMEYLPGYSAGVYVAHSFPDKNINIRLEIRYTSKGVRAVYSSNLGSPVFDRLEMTYLELPLWISFPNSPGKISLIHLGISLNHMVGWKFEPGYLSANRAIKYLAYRSFEMALLAGYRINLSARFWLLLNYSYSMNSLVSKRKVYHKSLRVNLYFDF